MNQEENLEKILDFIEKVQTYRQGVLLASAGALLHNLGKINSKFIQYEVDKDNYPEAEGYEFQHICRLFLEDVSKKNIDLTKEANKDFAKLYKRLDTCPVNIKSLLDATRNCLKQEIPALPGPFDDRTYRLGDLLEYLSSSWYKKNKATGKLEFEELGLFDSTLLTHLMNRSHHGASGGEKQDIDVQQQTPRLFIATPFGFEKYLMNLSKDAECDSYDETRKSVEKVIQEYLSNCLNPFPIVQFANKLRHLLQKALGDTQRPINDITVWDIGHSGMAFLKSAIWSTYINENDRRLTREAIADYIKYPRWRLWRCSFDGLDYLTGAVSIADLKVRQRKLQEYLDKVQALFEGAFPLGTEIYRDENGSMFVFPDIEPDGAEAKAVSELYDRLLFNTGNYGGEHFLEQVVQEAIENCEFIPGTASSMNSVYGIVPQEELAEENCYHHPECKGYDWKVEKRIDVHYIGDQIKEWITKPAAARPVDKVWQVYTENHKAKNLPDICPYCGLRPVGYGAETAGDDEEKPKNFFPLARKYKICIPCLSQRDKSSKIWLDNKRFSTIWVDEVADDNGHVALVVGEFDIEKMLEHLYYPYDEEVEKPVKYKPYWVGKCPPQKTTLKTGSEGEDYDYDGVYLVGKKLLYDDNRKYKRKDIEVYKLAGQPEKFKLLFERLEILPEKPDELNLYLKDDILLEKAKEKNIGNDWSALIDTECMSMGKTWKISGLRKLTYCGDSLEEVNDFACRVFYLEAKKGKEKYYFEPTLIVTLNPSNSFARLRRVWDTSANFWRDVLAPEQYYPEDELWKNALENSLVIKKWKNPLQRLKLTLQVQGDNEGFHKYQPYELVGKGLQCGLVFLKTNGQNHEFVTIENLGYIAGQLGGGGKDKKDPASFVKNFLEKQLRSTNFQIKETTGYGSRDKIRGSAFILNVSYDNEKYWPYIPILAEPRVFAALVPGQKAWDMVREIKNKYEQEMGKTRWRLPLKLGLVFFPHHLPLRFALDAGWRMLRSKTGALTAVVEEVERKSNNSGDIKSVDIKASVGQKTPRQDHERRATWKVPTVMGDQDTFDRWYPWVESKNKGYIHVNDLEERDEILFVPSTFDFVDLEHPGKRFQLYYNDTLQRPGSNRPYLLEEIDDLEKIWSIVSGDKGLTSTQLHNIWSLLLTKRQEWVSDRGNRDVWQEFCKQVILNAGWKGGLPAKEELDIVVRAAANDILFDVLELNLSLLKRDLSNSEVLLEHGG